MEATPLVLVVDDEPSVLRLVELELRVQGFQVHATSDPLQALELAEEAHPDLAVLDVVMPGMSGLELMAKLKAELSIPVILLTAKTSAQDKIRGLELGADDYIEKPFVPEDLSDRVRAVLRRSATGQVADLIANGNTEIDLKRRLVRRQGELLPLSRTEWTLLHHLASHAGETVENGELLSAVWGAEYRDDLAFLRAWVARLGQKIEDDPANPRLVCSVEGRGYRLAVPEQAVASGPATPR